jgi:hypothetical protein
MEKAIGARAPHSGALLRGYFEHHDEVVARALLNGQT